LNTIDYELVVIAFKETNKLIGVFFKYDLYSRFSLIIAEAK